MRDVPPDEDIQRIDWDALSETERKVLFDLFSEGNEGLPNKPHCGNCTCSTAEDFRPEERVALRSLQQHGYVVHDAMGILGDDDCWYFEDAYEQDITEFRADQGIYRERREAAEMRVAELAMTPVFPEFQAQFKKEDTAHVG